MAERNFEIGSLVKITVDEWKGYVGIVSQPISRKESGHVLLNKDGCVLGVQAHIQDVELADKSSEGFSQLAYNLIKLGSLVIEDRLILHAWKPRPPLPSLTQGDRSTP
jgi:hypothetical protein